MASIDWVDNISNIFYDQLNIDVEAPCSIFRVPEAITKQKPEAFEPQQIGLGPLHHFRQPLYKNMEDKKLAAMKTVLSLRDVELRVVVDNVQRIVPVVRGCYDMFLEDDNNSLAFVFAIDGVFLLDLFRYNTYELQVNWERRLLEQDIMMLENQIPFMVLTEINEALHEPPGDNLSPSIFRSFTEQFSPLMLCSPENGPADVKHLLQYMYHSIINDVPIYDLPQFFHAYPSWNFFEFIKRIPGDAIDRIVQIYERTKAILETFSQSKTIIPSASELHTGAGFTFHQLQDYTGIENIRVDDTDRKMIYLRPFTLNDHSEVILRNLVVYETSINTDNFPLTEFVGLMCALILNVNDVKLLEKNHIIEGSLEADEVVELFTSMRSSIPSITTRERSMLQRTIEEVNSVYDSKVKVKILFFLKKIGNGSLVVLRVIGRFVETLWKIMLFMVSIMLIWQAYCEVYGCTKSTDTLTSVRPLLARSE